MVCPVIVVGNHFSTFPTNAMDLSDCNLRGSWSVVMARPVLVCGDDIQMWNRHLYVESQTADRGWSSVLGVWQ